MLVTLRVTFDLTVNTTNGLQSRGAELIAELDGVVRETESRVRQLLAHPDHSKVSDVVTQAWSFKEGA